MPRADEPGDIAINVRSFLPQDADGTFRGVEHGGQKFSLEEWNARFENEPALLTD